MAEIPHWAKVRAVALAKEAAPDMNWGLIDAVGGTLMEAFARYIAEHETAPVDPDVLAVREILGAWDGKDYSQYSEGQDPDFDDALLIYREHASKRNG